MKEQAIKTELLKIFREVLKPGTDKGSSQAIINVKDFSTMADRVMEFYNQNKTK